MVYMLTGIASLDNSLHNPFATDLGRDHSSYAAYRDNALVHPLASNMTPAPVVDYVHDSFRALVLNPRFSCVGAKSAVQRGSYRFGHYPALGSAEATAGLAYDLHAFVQEQPSFDSEFSSMIATFSGAPVTSEQEFEQLLWKQLQQLHDLDAPHHRWDPAVSDDPADPAFSFSFAETGFFVVGLHAASSRFARRFAWPTLVFNLHAQFETLRASGRYERMQQVIRQRETVLQGSINPNLADFGVQSEARQYSGKAAGDLWRCPFMKRNSA